MSTATMPNPSRSTSPPPPTRTGPALFPVGRYDSQPPFWLDRPVTLIGSRQRAHIRLESDEVSRSHAVVVNAGGRVIIRDLASRTHVYVNGRQVEEAELSHGDHVNIGRFALRFAGGEGPAVEPEQVPYAGVAASLTCEGLESGVGTLDRALCVLGCRRGVDLLLRGSEVSFAHALVFQHEGRHYVRDLGSRTGTFVDGLSADEEVELRPDSVIRIGAYLLRYSPPGAPTPRAAAPRLPTVRAAPVVPDMFAASETWFPPAPVVPPAAKSQPMPQAHPAARVVPRPEPGPVPTHPGNAAAEYTQHPEAPVAPDGVTQTFRFDSNPPEAQPPEPSMAEAVAEEAAAETLASRGADRTVELPPADDASYGQGVVEEVLPPGMPVGASVIVTSVIEMLPPAGRDEVYAIPIVMPPAAVATDRPGAVDGSNTVDEIGAVLDALDVHHRRGHERGGIPPAAADEISRDPALEAEPERDAEREFIPDLEFEEEGAEPFHEPVPQPAFGAPMEPAPAAPAPRSQARAPDVVPPAAPSPRSDAPAQVPPLNWGVLAKAVALAELPEDHAGPGAAGGNDAPRGGRWGLKMIAAVTLLAAAAGAAFVFLKTDASTALRRFF